MLTLDHFKRRGWSFTNKCFFSLTEEESIVSHSHPLCQDKGFMESFVLPV